LSEAFRTILLKRCYIYTFNCLIGNKLLGAPRYQVSKFTAARLNCFDMYAMSF